MCDGGGRQPLTTSHFYFQTYPWVKIFPDSGIIKGFILEMERQSDTGRGRNKERGWGSHGKRFQRLVR